MSLNGLDTPQVQQAYSATISEAGGWFLLKYISRDEVDLLDSGRAGVSEARAAISQYQDLSPLYGLLVYRRRKVLVKYVPEGTSRLLQARTTVHLQDVQDRYSPYETMLEVTTADGVSDTALAAAFPLHTASPALSSNNQLNEITEDIEDGESPSKALALAHAPSLSSVSSRRPGLEKRPSSQRSYRSPSLPSAPFVADHSPVLKQKSSLSQFLVREELGHKSVTPLDEYQPSEDTPSTRDDTASTTSSRTETATSSAPSVRPSNGEYSGEQDLEKYLDQFFKPKIKLGPRPVHVSDKGKRGTAALPPNTRPVSSLPANFRSAHKPPSVASRSPIPESYTSVSPVPSFSSGPPRLPSLHFSPHIPDVPDFLPPRPSSRGSSRSLPASRASKQLLSPEKQRLMKALEIRKKQMRNSTPPEAPPAVPSVQSLSDVPEMPNPPAVGFHQSQIHDLRHETTVHKADSGIDVDEHTFHPDKTSSSPASQNLPFTAAPHLKPSDTDARSISSDHKHPEDTDADLSKKPFTTEDKGSTSVDSFSGLGITGATMPTMNGISSPHQATEITQTEEHAPQQEVTDPSPEKPAEETISDTHVEATIFDTPVEVSSTNKPFEDTVSSAQSEERTSAKPAEETISRKQDDGVASEDTSLHNDSEQEQKDESDFQKKRRRGLIEPLHINVNPEIRDPDQHFVVDEDFMDELHSATVEEATPIAMSRSPASPFFPPRRPSARSVKSSRSIASAISGDTVPSVPSVPLMTSVAPELLLPSPEYEAATSSRTPSVSSARTPDSERSDPTPLMRKATNVSSGISRRIQALAESSSREGSPPMIPGSRKLSADHLSTVAQRKSSFIDSAEARAAVASAEKKQPARFSKWSAPAMNTSNPSNVKIGQGQNNRDSVSVTARIVRVPRAAQENQAPQLQASPLLINHTRPAQTDNLPPLAPLITNNQASQSSDVDNNSALSPEGRPPPSRSSVDSSATTTTNRKSLSRLRGPESPKKLKQSATVPLPESSPEKASRTSRFFKRISHLGGNTKRKSVPQVPTLSANPIPEIAHPIPASPPAPVYTPTPVPASTLAPAPAIASASSVSLALSPSVSATTTTAPTSKNPRPASAADVPPPVSVGDLNVQFPDTMLWKRRWVEIDSIGNIMFTAARHSTNGKTFNSKFHLKELGAPFIPDIDSQEMPHSVLFDLVEGDGSLQLASEDSMSQRQLLSLLTTYHQAWMAV